MNVLAKASRNQQTRQSQGASHDLIRVTRQENMVMGPVRSETKNDCAEGLQEITRQDQVKEVSWQQSNPTSHQRESHISKHVNDLGKTKILLWVPTGPETKNDSAGEGQQQITALLRSTVSHQPVQTGTTEHGSRKRNLHSQKLLLNNKYVKKQ